MPGLWTDTLTTLYKNIIANPADDTVRLIFADALAEMDREPYLTRATFIRKQVELATIGPRPKVFNADLSGCGPNRYRFITAEGECKVGKRVTIESRAPNAKPRMRHGLLVTQIDVEDGMDLVMVKEDEYSQPYPSKRAKQLEKECYDLLFSGIGTFDPSQYFFWGLSVPHLWAAFYIHDSCAVAIGIMKDNADRPLIPPVHLWWRRGFVSAVRSSWYAWRALGDYLVEHSPLCSVALEMIPPFDLEERESATKLFVGASIAGKLVECEVVGDHDDIVVERHLIKLRWPTIPSAGWTFLNSDWDSE